MITITCCTQKGGVSKTTTCEAIILYLRKQGYKVLAIEQCQGSTMLDQWQPDFQTGYAVVMGNEVKGVQQSVVDIYKVYKQRKSINERMKAQIKDICPILIKGSIEEGRKD